MPVTFEATTTVDASAADPLAACKLTSSLSLVLYQRAGNIKARTITIGAPLVANAEVDINGITSFPIALARVSDTSAMAVYVKTAVGMVAQMLTIAGTVVTGNVETVMTDSVADKYDLSRIDGSNVLCAYSANPNDANAVVLSISGTTITENAIVVLDGTVSAHGITCVAYSTTKAIVTWFDTGTPHEGMVIDIAGTVITTNTKKTIDAVNSGFTTGQGLINGYVSVFMSSTKAVYAFDNAASDYKAYVLTLSGSTFNIGPVVTIGGTGSGRLGMAGLSTTNLIIVGKTSGTVYTAEGFTITGGSSDTLTSQGSDTKTITTTDWAWCAAVDGSNILVHFEIASSGVALVSFVAATHLWLSTDGGATYTDIGDSAWGTDLVGGVVVVPGTAYQTIFAAVDTDLHKTTNGGTVWSLETAVGYEVDFIDLEKDNTTVFLAKRDAAGTNRASLWDGAVLTHINTGKSTTGGATSGGDVV